MAKFILIDHSLRSVGGHHYEYADQIAREAERAQYEIVLATHRSFRKPSTFPDSWRVLPLFCYDVYNRYAIPWGRGGARTAWSEQWASCESPRQGKNPAKWLDFMGRSIRRLNRRRRLRRFADSCGQLFRTVDPQPDDIVFVATISAFDLLALTSFLRQEPRTAEATWHLQFHHDILEGREADYKRQNATLQAVNRVIGEGLDQVPHHRIVFHATTAQLAAEYNRLGVGDFAELPYPVNPMFFAPGRQVDTHRSPGHAQASTSRYADGQTASSPEARSVNHQQSHPRCLKITCAGGMRREKGSHDIAELIDTLWKPYIATGRVRLRVQTNWRRFQLLSRGHKQQSLNGRDPPLERIPHPLEWRDYVDLIHTSDVGLLLYDSWSYYTRASGILVEMLAAGVPVIVPAGCWLAKQVAEPIYRYLDRIHRDTPPIRRLGLADARWSRPLGARKLCFGGPFSDVRAELDVPQEANCLFLRFRHTAAADTGRYVQIRTAQRNSKGARMDESLSVLDPREPSEQAIGAIFPLSEDPACVQLEFLDAFNCGVIEITDVEFSFISARDSDGTTLPTGAVGLIASDASQIPRLLAEMVDHHGHYRRTAEEFSHEWMKRHSPRNTFTTLMARDAEALRSDKKSRAA